MNSAPPNPSEGPFTITQLSQEVGRTYHYVWELVSQIWHEQPVPAPPWAPSPHGGREHYYSAATRQKLLDYFYNSGGNEPGWNTMDQIIDISLTLVGPKVSPRPQRRKIFNANATTLPRRLGRPAGYRSGRLPYYYPLSRVLPWFLTEIVTTQKRSARRRPMRGIDVLWHRGLGGIPQERTQAALAMLPTIAQGWYPAETPWVILGLIIDADIPALAAAPHYSLQTLEASFPGNQSGFEQAIAPHLGAARITLDSNGRVVLMFDERVRRLVQEQA
jgi:hypothetical protein